MKALIKPLCCFLAGVCPRDVPHTRVGIPDQQRVRALLQVHAHCQGVSVLWWHGYQEG